jgi:hypothetical protein
VVDFHTQQEKAARFRNPLYLANCSYVVIDVIERVDAGYNVKVTGIKRYVMRRCGGVLHLVFVDTKRPVLRN